MPQWSYNHDWQPLNYRCHSWNLMLSENIHVKWTVFLLSLCFKPIQCDDICLIVVTPPSELMLGYCKLENISEQILIKTHIYYIYMYIYTYIYIPRILTYFIYILKAGSSEYCNLNLNKRFCYCPEIWNRLPCQPAAMSAALMRSGVFIHSCTLSYGSLF